MRKQELWGYLRCLLFLAVLVLFGFTAPAFAQSASSTHYSVSETEFGSGSTKQACSTTLCAQTSIGDIATGNSSSTTTKAAFGSVTPNTPSLSVIVDSGTTELGVLTTERTATKSSIVKIQTYLSSGYQLQITGDPPKYANHNLATPSTPTASTAGTEQFGINLVANTLPSIGTLPVQVPSGTFSFGSVLSGYNSANLFKYASGDTVAQSTTETGETDYTVSFIINIANNTPAGHYTGSYAAVVIPIF